MASNYQPRQQQQQPRLWYKLNLIEIFVLFIGTKEKVKLQRIPPSTKWKQAKIEIVDSLSGFYVQNLDKKVYDKFQQMEEELR